MSVASHSLTTSSRSTGLSGTALAELGHQGSHIGGSTGTALAGTSLSGTALAELAHQGAHVWGSASTALAGTALAELGEESSEVGATSSSAGTALAEFAEESGEVWGATLGLWDSDGGGQSAGGRVSLCRLCVTRGWDGCKTLPWYYLHESEDGETHIDVLLV
jgi:hypothetical protein